MDFTKAHVSKISISTCLLKSYKCVCVWSSGKLSMGIFSRSTGGKRFGKYIVYHDTTHIANAPLYTFDLIFDTIFLTVRRIYRCNQGVRGFPDIWRPPYALSLFFLSKINVILPQISSSMAVQSVSKLTSNVLVILNASWYNTMYFPFIFSYAAQTCDNDKRALILTGFYHRDFSSRFCVVTTCGPISRFRQEGRPSRYYIP